MMALQEVNLLGIFVSPALVCLLAALVLAALLRRVFDHFDLDRYIWNRAVFDLGLLVCITDLLVLSLHPVGR